LAIRRRVAADVGTQIRERKRLTHVQFADFGFDPNFAVSPVIRFNGHGIGLLFDAHVSWQKMPDKRLCQRKIDKRQYAIQAISIAGRAN
jgi:hypothetical protein